MIEIYSILYNFLKYELCHDFAHIFESMYEILCVAFINYCEDESKS